MRMELRKNCRYALVVPSSMGIRIAPPSGQPVHCASSMFMQATSAETNVASIASFLGLPVKVLTTFVKGSPIAQFIKDMEIALAEADRMNLALPGLKLVHELYRAVQAQGHGKSGTHALYLALESMSKL